MCIVLRSHNWLNDNVAAGGVDNVLGSRLIGPGGDKILAQRPVVPSSSNENLHTTQYGKPASILRKTNGCLCALTLKLSKASRAYLPNPGFVLLFSTRYNVFITTLEKTKERRRKKVPG